MPTQPSWFQRVPEILAALEDPSAPPFLDRAAIEKLFLLSRRQSIRLMASCSGFQTGRSFLVERDQLVQFLRTHQRRDEIDSSVTRRRRILDLLAQPRLTVSSRLAVSELAALPPGINLERRRLEVQFSGAVDLLQKLVALSQALSQDFENFERLVE